MEVTPAGKEEEPRFNHLAIGVLFFKSNIMLIELVWLKLYRGRMRLVITWLVIRLQVLYNLRFIKESLV